MEKKDDTQVCTRCGEEKSLEHFYVFYRDPQKTKAYVRPDCKHCFNRMSRTGKVQKRYSELTKGKAGSSSKRKASYRYNREEILSKVRKHSSRFTKKEESALVEGDLSELMEKKVGKRKSKKSKNDKSGVTTTKRRSRVSRSKDSSV